MKPTFSHLCAGELAPDRATEVLTKIEGNSELRAEVDAVLAILNPPEKPNFTKGQDSKQEKVELNKAAATKVAGMLSTKLSNIISNRDPGEPLEVVIGDLFDPLPSGLEKREEQVLFRIKEFGSDADFINVDGLIIRIERSGTEC